MFTHQQSIMFELEKGLKITTNTNIEEFFLNNSQKSFDSSHLGIFMGNICIDISSFSMFFVVSQKLLSPK